MGSLLEISRGWGILLLWTRKCPWSILMFEITPGSPIKTFTRIAHFCKIDPWIAPAWGKNVPGSQRICVTILWIQHGWNYTTLHEWWNQRRINTLVSGFTNVTWSRGMSRMSLIMIIFYSKFIILSLFIIDFTKKYYSQFQTELWSQSSFLSCHPLSYIIQTFS